MSEFRRARTFGPAPAGVAGAFAQGLRMAAEWMFGSDKAGGALASDVVVFGLGEEKVPLYGRTVLIDVYIPDDLVGRFQGKNLGDFAVVQGSCGEVSTTTTETTATTSPPTTVTTAPADSTVPTQPPDQGGPQ